MNFQTLTKFLGICTTSKSYKCCSLSPPEGGGGRERYSGKLMPGGSAPRSNHFVVHFDRKKVEMELHLMMSCLLIKGVGNKYWDFRSTFVTDRAPETCLAVVKRRVWRITKVFILFSHISLVLLRSRNSLTWNIRLPWLIVRKFWIWIYRWDVDLVSLLLFSI